LTLQLDYGRADPSFFKTTTPIKVAKRFLVKNYSELHGKENVGQNIVEELIRQASHYSLHPIPIALKPAAFLARDAPFDPPYNANLPPRQWWSQLIKKQEASLLAVGLY
jgi:hypothetical protein